MSKIITTLLLGSLISILLMVSYPSGDRALEAEFQGFINTYGSSYTSDSEHAFRLEVFKKNMEKAAEFQSMNPLAEFGITPFSDRTEEEMARMMGLIEHEEPKDEEDQEGLKWIDEYYSKKSYDTLTSRDWSKHMQPITNQKSCGSCWAFSTMAVLEGYRSIRGQETVKLSEQELVDCVPNCYGCRGGVAAYAYHWLKSNHACSRSSYPYTALDQTCRYSSCTKVRKTAGAGYIISGEAGILHKLQNSGPVSVAVDASLWGSYRHGIITGGCGTSINHAVAATGFVGHTSYPHYVIRNSWSSRWGEQGTVRILYGQNVCGIKRQSSFPVFH